MVGAGIVGVCCAIALARAGHGVDLIDAGPAGGTQAASFGNGGWISPASVVPLSTPGLLGRLPGLLADRDGPLVLRPLALPALAGWMWQFVRSGADLSRVQATSTALAMLLRDAPERHACLAADADVADLFRPSGLLYAYPDATALDADGLGWALRRAADVAIERLEGPALRSAAPLLSPRFRLAMRVPAGAYVSDPGAYTQALQSLAERLGVRTIRAEVRGGRFDAGRLRALCLSSAAGMRDPGDDWPVSQVVLASGFGSAALMKALSRAVGGPALRVRLASERGYHLVLPGQLPWPQPVMPSDGRMAVTLTPQGLRVAGQVELAPPDAPPDWHRVRVLWRHAKRVLSPEGSAALGLGAVELARDDPPPNATRWMGHRPSTTDGLPVIGPFPGCEGLLVAYGHGHVGLATAPLTAAAVVGWLERGLEGAQAVLGHAVAQACAPERFGR